MAQKSLILVTNDDGYQAKGINSLIEFLTGFGEIVVVAPDGPRSGMSGAITHMIPIRYELINQDTERDVKIYKCTGTPVDCVKLGINEILDRKPDLLVSGINHGSNASISVHYSGTMGAAIEGCIFGIPSIGFSLLNHNPEADFSGGKEIIQALCKEVLTSGLPENVCLNVNIPKGTPKGIKVCRQASGKWEQEFVSSQDGRGEGVYWLTGKFKNNEPDKVDTDEWVLDNNFAAVVPIKTDLTAHETIERMKSWENLL